MADDLDLVTLAEAKEAINFDSASTTHDAVFTQWITGVSRRIDELCGPVVRRTVSDEHHPGGGTFIVPHKRPVLAVTTIKEYDGITATTLTAEDLAAGTATANDYYLDPESSHIYRRTSGYPTHFAPTRVILTYSAGRGSAAATNDVTTVDAKFKLCVGAILRRLHGREAGAWSRGGDPFVPEGSTGFFKVIDPMVQEWLEDELESGPTVPVVG